MKQILNNTQVFMHLATTSENDELLTQTEQ